MDDLTEMIADAKAEEEVKNAQINRRIASASPAMVTIHPWKNITDSGMHIEICLS